MEKRLGGRGSGASGLGNWCWGLVVVAGCWGWRWGLWALVMEAAGWWVRVTPWLVVGRWSRGMGGVRKVRACLLVRFSEPTYGVNLD